MNDPIPTSTNQLPRVLGFWTATAIVVGTVIGSGVFKKPQAVSTEVSEFGLAMVAWVLGGLLAVFGALSLAEVAVRFPRAGGNYVFLREGYGRMAGFLWGWVEFWIIRSASIAALASIFTESLHDILREVRGLSKDEDVFSFWALQGVTAVVIAVLAMVNARGTALGGMLQLFITTVKILSLMTIALLPFIIGALVAEPRARPNVDNLSPLFPESVGGIDWAKFGAALVGVLWAYHGWMNVAPVAEEVKNPNRNLPLALICGTVLIIVLYLSVNLAYYLMIPSHEMKNVTTRSVAGEFSFRLLGPAGLIFASTAIMISVFGSLNGNLLVGPRLLYAMSKDRLAPASLSRLHPRYETPALATGALALWSIVIVVGGAVIFDYRMGEWKDAVAASQMNAGVTTPPGQTTPAIKKPKATFDVVTDFAMFGAISFETLAVASIFVFRRRYGTADLPYRCPLYPVIPVLYVMVMAAVLANMFSEQPTESQIGLGFIEMGALVYLSFFRRREGTSS
jgi:APA family basic amino acid/polyamine antiporter